MSRRDADPFQTILLTAVTNPPHLAPDQRKGISLSEKGDPIAEAPQLPACVSTLALTAAEVTDQIEVDEDFNRRLSLEVNRLLLSHFSVSQASVDRLTRLFRDLATGGSAHTQLLLLSRTDPNLLSEGAVTRIARKDQVGPRPHPSAAERAYRSWGRRL